MKPLKTSSSGPLLHVGACAISFERTLRVPEQGDEPYPLPPTFGSFPLIGLSVQPLRFAIPIYRCEAMWMAFDCPHKPCAVLIGAGGTNALTGEPWDEHLDFKRQNYLVCPEQPWLDGFNAGEGYVRQFVATPLGAGRTVSEQLGHAGAGGIQIVVYEAHPDVELRRTELTAAPAAAAGLAAGGRIRQSIYPDPYGADAWDLNRKGTADIDLISPARFEQITGLSAPTTPISARVYRERGYPWFDLYDEKRGAIAASKKLKEVKGVGSDDKPFRVPDKSIKKLRRSG